MSGGSGGNTYSARLPASLGRITVGDLQTRFGRRFGATLIAVRSGGQVVVSPPWDSEIDVGSTVYYLGRERIETAGLAELGRHPVA
ncbi:MAG: hypothetical protein L0K86_25550 [Actinomycetia bacterium]|nr:hypothetical protein [Actinomycetes bacterium]